MDWHDGRNEMGTRLPFYSGSQIISLREGIIERGFLFSFFCHHFLFLLSSEPSGECDLGVFFLLTWRQKMNRCKMRIILLVRCVVLVAAGVNVL